ncbi:hypothetical protein [Mycolicibacterium goodii]|uniref:Uncharacterized protein n=1 Tax=Mycolicibacterium goodii TaxID=134601 RepID=A0A0K0X7D3_MYCGD|nr:hypothetical protein AFA91_17030 [Mycolicibacterium goodii]
MNVGERGLWIENPRDRRDLMTFVDRALRLDEAAVVRFRERRDTGHVVAWVATGFDVLASRVVPARVRPHDMSAGADTLALSLAGSGDHVDPGFPMDSAWRGALPPEDGFVHLDDVPARVVLDLAQQGLALAREHSSAHGPPASLLDQEVLSVTGGDITVGIPMRCVFALTAMGFLPQTGDEVSTQEIVRVRAHAAWLRIDARFGSVYRRRGQPTLILN